MREAKILLHDVPSVANSSGLAVVFLVANLAVLCVGPSIKKMATCGAPLPTLTWLVLSAPAFVWVIVGVLGAILIIANFVNRAVFIMLAVYCVGLWLCILSPLIGLIEVIKSIK